jgi:hypothetical protein
MQTPIPNNRTIHYLAWTSTLALAVCLWAGCTTPSYQKKDIAAASMQEAAMDVQAETRQLDQTLASLGDLMNGTNEDLKVPFERYSRALDQLILCAERTDKTGKSMQQKSAAFLEDWDRQMQTIDYQHIRELSDTRRSEVTNRVAALNQRYNESQAAVQPLISYLQDIRKALSIDLTTSGLASMKGVAQNAQNNVAKVQTALDALSAELTSSSAHLSSVAYQPATPSPQTAARH